MKVFQRPLIPCLFAFVFGLWLMHTYFLGQALIAFGLVLLVAAGAVGYFVRFRDSTGMILLLVVLAGCFRILPAELERRDAVALAKTFTPAPHVLQGTVASAESLDTARGSLVLKNVTMTSESETVALPGRVRLALTGFDEAGRANTSYVAGDTVQALAIVQEPRALRNFFRRSTRETLARQGIYYSATIKSAGLVQRVRTADGFVTHLRHWLGEVRRKTQDIMVAAMPAHPARLMVCMLFNDMRQLTEEDSRVFRDSGTMHLFAVSGMHVAIFALILNMLFRACRCTPRLSWCLVLLVLFLYMVLLDFIPPALRAFLMVLACTLGRITGREIDSLSSLAFGVFLMILCDPLAPWQVGFQLSIMGVVAILLIAPQVALWFAREVEFTEVTLLDRVRNMARESINITLAVTLTLLPLQLFYFQQFNLMSPLANVLEAFLAGPVLAAAVVVTLLGFVSTALAGIAGAGAALIMRVVYEIARWTADADWAIVQVPEFSTVIVLGCYLLLFSGYYVVTRHSPEFVVKARARFAIHSMGCLSLLVLTAAWGDFERPLRIWFLDVGQGDSTLVQLPNGQTLLIDAGTNLPSMGKMVVLPQLKALGIRQLDYLVATHPDSDHTGGIPDVLRNQRVHALIEPDEETARTDDEITSELRAICAYRHIPEFQPCAGDIKAIGSGCKIEVLNPPADPMRREALKDNERSVVLRISYGKFSTLLMADAGAAVERRLLAEGLSPCTVLKIGHHGSRTSSTPEFIRAVAPEAAVISCGLKNRYNHPHPDVLGRLEAVNTRICRTDLHGAVLVETDGNSYTLQTATE